MELKQWIRDVPDFPKSGILFRDITPLLNEPKALAFTLDRMTELAAGLQPSRVVGIEARGFLFGTAIANRLDIGFVPVRKPGKLPAATVSESYALEYGEDSLEIHQDALSTGDRVLVVDDLLATGGTARATSSLVQKLGADVAGLLFLVELCELGGRARLEGHRVEALVQY